MPSTGGSPRRMEPAVFPELSGRGGRSPVPAEAEEGDRAHTILHRAEQQAQALMGSARQRAAAAVEAGYREGSLQGHAEALAESRGRLQRLGTSLEDAVGRIHVLEEEIRGQGPETIVRLALAVAERIVRTHTAQDPEVVLRAARTALAVLPEPGEVLVRLHPDQEALLQAHRAELLAIREGVTTLRFLPDAAIEPGGCLVEAPTCLVDATVAAQLEEAGRRLRDGSA